MKTEISLKEVKSMVDVCISELTCQISELEKCFGNENVNRRIRNVRASMYSAILAAFEVQGIEVTELKNIHTFSDQVDVAFSKDEVLK